MEYNQALGSGAVAKNKIKTIDSGAVAKLKSKISTLDRP